MAFTEFYANASTGSNVNSGSTESATPVLQLTGGDWVSATGVFTKTGAITGVTVGMFAAVMVDAGTVAARIGRVTAVDANTVTISTTAGSGSLANQTATCTITVGGCWKGPNGSVDFPLDFITNAATNSSGDSPRVNLKNNATYSITATMAPNQAGPIVIEGYSSTAGDGGRAIIDGGTSGAAYVIMALGGTADRWRLASLTFQHNGATGTAIGIDMTAGSDQCVIENCKFFELRGGGIDSNGLGTRAIECEFTSCNQSNTASNGGCSLVSGEILRCYSHDNTGSNCFGFRAWGTHTTIANSISESNGGDGIICLLGGSGLVEIRNCEIYNNTGDGIDLGDTNGGVYVLENNNFVKNGGWGINGSGAGARIGTAKNNGFGSGTQANASGAVTGLKGIFESGSVTYPSNLTPWNDPANGDFTIVLPEAMNAGRGVIPGTTNTTGYPSIGAAEPKIRRPLVGPGRIRN